MADYISLGGSGGYEDYSFLVLKILAIAISGYLLGGLANRLIVGFGRKTLAWRMEDLAIRETRFGSNYDLIDLSGSIARYTVYMVFSIVIFDQIGLGVLRDLLVEFWHYFPNVVAAFIMVLAGVIIADALGKLTKLSLSGSGADEMFKEAGKSFLPSVFFAAIIRYFIYLLVATMALTQLGFQTLLLTIVVGSFAAISTLFLFAMAGLGLKGMMPDMVSGAYLRSSGFVKSGDVIEIRGFKGRVKGVGLLATELDGGAQKMKVPNSAVLEGIKTFGRK